ncbi:MAG: prepilin-type N-terminal cleavage/methylation domain-containing protein [Acidobacteria bacterium]|nr:prepilin-type N-terminal cleavage/methylation domain-containing protein [Acidobacteriota bacterium]
MAPRASSESGFTLLELLVATALSLVVLGAAFTAFQSMADANDGAVLLSDVNLNLRNSLTLITRDLVSAGRDIPVGGIPIPSGADADPLVRPAPTGVALTFPAADGTLAAVTTGQALGPIINGVATDMITVLMSDPLLDLTSEFLTDVAADGSSVTVDPAIPIDDPVIGVAAGDLIMLSNSLGFAIQMVTGRTGQVIEFAEGDPMNLNQRDTGQGTIIQLQSAPGEYPPTSAMRVLMISYYIDDTQPDRPRLIRRVNLGGERVIAVGIENLQLAYDLVDGVTDPVNLPEPVLPNTPDQIRKANVFLSGRSFREWRRADQLLRTSVSTQVGLRSLSFRDRY